jgi:16S rRNA (cytidine1402-2'-O)-methyltransferase
LYKNADHYKDQPDQYNCFTNIHSDKIEMATKGKLLLIPTIIAEGTQDKVIPPQTKNELKNIQHFLAENVRTARRFLSSLQIYDRIESLNFKVLNKETREDELDDLLEPVYQGFNLGILSESGSPGIADPGALAVMYAHKHAIKVVPLVGPSSVILALMASGLNGQHFAFHGYLPIETKEREKSIRLLENDSSQKNQTQIFIETPYRNGVLYSALLKNLKPHTKLCIAIDINGEQELIETRSVREWKSKSIDLPKLPAIFLFLHTQTKV